MKPAVLFLPLDMRSHVLRCLQLADAIGDRYQAHIGTRDFGALVQQRGHRAERYDALSSDLVLEHGRRLDNSWLNAGVLTAPLTAQVALIRRLSPACVVNDTSFTAQLAAEATGVPCASIINGLFSRHLAIDRPVPMRHPARAVSRFFPAAMTRAAERLALRLMHGGFERIRRAWGLRARPDHLSEFEGDLNFLADTPEFAPQRGLPANFLAMGPLYHRSSDGDSDVLEAIDPRKKTILVNLGGTGDPGVLEALTRPAFARFNLISVGWGPRRLTAPHIITREFLDLEAVLPRVDLVLTQGGTGNLFQTWSHGIPTVIFPTFFEQEWNAARAVAMDVGAALTSPPTVEQLAEAVEFWIAQKNSPRLRAVAASISVEQSKAVFRRGLQAFLQMGSPMKLSAEGAQR